MTTPDTNCAAVIRPSKVKKLLISVILGIITPILLAIMLNQALAATTAAPEQAGSATVAADIYAILISDKADSDGYVTENKKTVPGSATRIYVTVQITNASPGIKVSTTISGANGFGTEPAVNVTSKSGNIMKAFTFTNGNNAWPQGEYKVDVSLSSGATKSTSFTVGAG